MVNVCTLFSGFVLYSSYNVSSLLFNYVFHVYIVHVKNNIKYKAYIHIIYIYNNNMKNLQPNLTVYLPDEKWTKMKQTMIRKTSHIT